MLGSVRQNLQVVSFGQLIVKVGGEMLTMATQLPVHVSFKVKCFLICDINLRFIQVLKVPTIGCEFKTKRCKNEIHTATQPT